MFDDIPSQNQWKNPQFALHSACLQRFANLKSPWKGCGKVLSGIGLD